MKPVFSIGILAVIIVGLGYASTTGPGEYTVGEIYYSALHNPVAATPWFQKAAIKGYAPVESWVQPAAEAGYAPARFDLGLAMWEGGDSYYVGDGVLQDDDKAKALWTLAIDSLIKPAAEQGYAPAGYLLAVAYVNGNGVTQDEDKALSILLGLANQGYAPAEYFLGLRIAIGGDTARGKYWVDQAKGQGYTKETPY